MLLSLVKKDEDDAATDETRNGLGPRSDWPGCVDGIVGEGCGMHSSVEMGAGRAELRGQRARRGGASRLGAAAGGRGASAASEVGCSSSPDSSALLVPVAPRALSESHRASQRRSTFGFHAQLGETLEDEVALLASLELSRGDAQAAEKIVCRL